MNAPPDIDDPVLRAAEGTLRGLRRWHRHRVEGIEHIPVEGPAVVAVNHSLATYDVGLLVLAVYERTGRVMRGLGHSSLFRTPGLRSLVPRLGVIEADPEASRRLLEAGELVVVAPGGMREALRPSTEKHTVAWRNRKGFARLAVETGAPVVLAACPRADDVYTVYRSGLTRKVYDRVRLPLPVARGLGVSALPRPVGLTHVVRPAFAPPETGDEAALDAFHGQLVTAMDLLMTEALLRP